MRPVFIFRQIKSLFIRELTILSTNMPLLLLLFIAPVAYSFLYTSIFAKKIERDVPICIIDNDHSDHSRKLIRQLDAHEMIMITEEPASSYTIKETIQSFRYMAVLTIPEGFEKKLLSMQQAKISVVVNSTRFLISNDVMKGINDVVGNFNESILIKIFQKKGISSENAKALMRPITLNSKSLYNTTESYGDFIIIALLILILQQSLLIISAASFTHEIETHSIRDLFHKISGSPFLFFAGKMGLYFIIFCLYTVFFTSFHFYIYKIPFTGSIFAFSILTIMLFITIMAIGALIGSFFPTKFSVLIVTVFSSYPVFLLSGYSWPIQAFPDFLKIIAKITPQTHYFTGFTCITQQGGAITDIIPQLLSIGIAMLVCSCLFMIRIYYLRKRIAKT